MRRIVVVRGAAGNIVRVAQGEVAALLSAAAASHAIQSSQHACASNRPCELSCPVARAAAAITLPAVSSSSYSGLSFLPDSTAAAPLSSVSGDARSSAATVPSASVGAARVSQAHGNSFGRTRVSAPVASSLFAPPSKMRCDSQHEPVASAVSGSPLRPISPPRVQRWGRGRALRVSSRASRRGGPSHARPAWAGAGALVAPPPSLFDSVVLPAASWDPLLLAAEETVSEEQVARGSAGPSEVTITIPSVSNVAASSSEALRLSGLETATSIPASDPSSVATQPQGHCESTIITPSVSNVAVSSSAVLLPSGLSASNLTSAPGPSSATTQEQVAASPVVDDNSTLRPLICPGAARGRLLGRDARGRAAMKDPVATESRAPKHATIRDPHSRTNNAIRADIYQQLLECELTVERVPVRQKSMRNRVRRLLKQGVTIGRVFNVVSGVEENRLLDARRRMIIQEEEILPALTFLWNDGYQQDTNHTLRIRAAELFAGLGPEKIERFLAQMINPKTRNFKVPHVQTPRHVLSSRPMEHVQIDCSHMHSVFYLGVPVTGFISFLDIYSKLIFAWPITAECSWEVCRAFVLFCCIYGVPEIVQTDNGAAFCGEMTRLATQVFGCRVIHGRPRYPQAQGGVEKSHLGLKNATIGLSMEHFGDLQRWPEMLHLAMRSVNNTGHAVFNEELTPFTVFFGRMDNKPLALDRKAVKGTFLQVATRVQTLEEKQMARLAPRVNLEHYLNGDKCYQVDFRVTPPYASDEERIYVEIGADLQVVLDRARFIDPPLTDVRIAYTEQGIRMLDESSSAIREIMEYHRICGESVLRQNGPDGRPGGHELSAVLRAGFATNPAVREQLGAFASFSTAIRDAAAKFVVAYVESVDAGTRKRMPTPYQQNDAIWVLTLSEDKNLCNKYKELWASATDRRLRERVPGVIRSVDTASLSRPYEVEIFIDGLRARAEGRTTCELAWLSGMALAPSTGFQKKWRQFGTLQQVPGLCIGKSQTDLYCLRRANDSCAHSLCEVHCKEREGGDCGNHRRKIPLFRTAPA